MLSDEPFDQSRFARRYAEEFEGQRIHVSSPEDTILMKLRWAELSGGSEKQFGDGAVSMNCNRIRSTCHIWSNGQNHLASQLCGNG